MDPEPSPRPALLYPLASTVSATTTVLFPMLFFIAFQLDDPTVLAWGSLFGWWIGHGLAAGLAFAARAQDPRGTGCLVGSLLAMGAPLVAFVAFLIWLSQQQLWTIL